MQIVIIVVVALRKESVDRNLAHRLDGGAGHAVALRKESVDRNLRGCTVPRWPFVALRKESVDRNAATVKGMNRDDRRSPQGERG